MMPIRSKVQPRYRTLFPWLAMVLIIMLSATSADSGEQLLIKIRPFREFNIDITREFKYQLLELILDKTKASDGPYRIEVVGRESIAQARVMDLMDQGVLNLLISMTSREREERLRPIRIPVYKGLWGYRLFIIKRSNLRMFAAIKDEKKLKQLWAGQGHDWPDTEILKANGYNVTTSPNYRGLFAMLEQGRFDYFPRGINEPWREVEEESARDLVVEPTLAIHYISPVYIFTSKNNIKLADRLKRGFEAALADGSYQRLFDTHWYIKEALDWAKLDNRLIFQLNNPFLTPETPLGHHEFWHQPE